MIFIKFSNHIRRKVVNGGGYTCDRDLVKDWISDPLNAEHGVVQVRHDPTNVSIKVTTNRRERDSPGSALDQLRLERRLKLLDPATERRLRDRNQPSSGAKRVGLGERFKGNQIIEIDTSHFIYLYFALINLILAFNSSVKHLSHEGAIDHDTQTSHV
jgi:hypothetical protein